MTQVLYHVGLQSKRSSEGRIRPILSGDLPDKFIEPGANGKEEPTMRSWLTLTKDEKVAARGGRRQFENKERMNRCLQDVLALLTGDAKATAKAWKITWGNYLINTPAEIVAYCKAAAVQD